MYVHWYTVNSVVCPLLLGFLCCHIHAGFRLWLIKVPVQIFSLHGQDQLIRRENDKKVKTCIIPSLPVYVCVIASMKRNFDHRAQQLALI